MSGKQGRIAVIGSNMVDLVTYVARMPVKGETVEAPSFEMGHGGKGANQAVAAAKLGASVMMVTKVGDDMFADNTIRNLASFGVDTNFVSFGGLVSGKCQYSESEGEKRERARDSYQAFHRTSWATSVSHAVPHPDWL